MLMRKEVVLGMCWGLELNDWLAGCQPMSGKHAADFGLVRS